MPEDDYRGFVWYEALMILMKQKDIKEFRIKPEEFIQIGENKEAIEVMENSDGTATLKLIPFSEAVVNVLNIIYPKEKDSVN